MAMKMPKLSPLTRYNKACAEGFIADSAQAAAIDVLENCYNQLQNNLPTLGVYLHGPVGRGKTWMMDVFFASLSVPAKRQHFHHFTRWMHQRLFQLIGTPDPLTQLAKELKQEVDVLCFDELFVHDIGDAMLLGGLFQRLFAQNLVLVCTSNNSPDDLYNPGFNRESFLPAIASIKQHMQVVGVDGGQDHRLHKAPKLQRYWVKNKQDDPLRQVFYQLAQGAVKTGKLQLAQRQIDTLAYSDNILYCRFAQLCDVPLAAQDFIELAGRFSAIFLTNVPCLSAEQQAAKIARGTEDAVEQVKAGDRLLPQLAKHDDSVRRFIALVDECYDQRVPLYIEADVDMQALYTEGYLAFSFQRTLSRLQEMQQARFTAGLV